MPEEKIAPLVQSFRDFFNSVFETGTFTVGEFQNLFQKFFTDTEKKFAELGYRENRTTEVENILVPILDDAGDFIVTSPVLREIRKNFPTAHITLIVNKSVYPLAEFCPYVNGILKFDVENGIPLEEETFECIDFAGKYLLNRHFTLSFCFQYLTHRQIYLSYFGGAKIRVGHLVDREYNLYSDGKIPAPIHISNFLLTHPVLHPKEIFQETDRAFHVLKSVGLKVDDTRSELWYTGEDLFQAKKILEGFAPGRIKIALGIGGKSHPGKIYPVAQYLSALQKIIAKGAAVLIFGGSTETDDAKFLQENLPAEFAKNIVALKSGWRLTSALISLSDLYIGNDTGTAHIAAAAKLPVITVICEAKSQEGEYGGGIRNFRRFFPRQTPAIVLRPEKYLGDCAKKFFIGGCSAPEPHCIKQIQPDEIISAYDKIIDFMQKQAQA